MDKGPKLCNNHCLVFSDVFERHRHRNLACPGSVPPNSQGWTSSRPGAQNVICSSYVGGGDLSAAAVTFASQGAYLQDTGTGNPAKMETRCCTDAGIPKVLLTGCHVTCHRSEVCAGWLFWRKWVNKLNYESRDLKNQLEFCRTFVILSAKKDLVVLMAPRYVNITCGNSPWDIQGFHF